MSLIKLNIVGQPELPVNSDELLKLPEFGYNNIEIIPCGAELQRWDLLPSRNIVPVKNVKAAEWIKKDREKDFHVRKRFESDNDKSDSKTSELPKNIRSVETVYQMLKQIKDHLPASVKRFTKIAFNALYEAKQELQKLFGSNQTNWRETEDADPLNWLTTAMESLQTTQLTEKILSIVARSVGSGWELIMSELGLSSVDVDHCQMKHPNDPVMQIFEGLKTWMKRSSQPTAGSLLQAMERCCCANVDWNRLKGYFAGVECSS